MLVHQVTQLRQCLKGAMVTARLARVAQEPGRGKSSCDPKHYSVVLMHYAGQPLNTLNLKQCGALCGAKAMFVTRGVASTCLRLYENGFVYSDLKPANVLYAGLDYNTIRLTLCDYGSLAAVGATDAVATYPPPEHPFGTSVHATERAVVYGLGVLLVCLFAADLEYSLRYLKCAKHKKGGCRADKGRVHVCTADAVLAMQIACDNAIGALRARDESIARLVQLAWHPRTTIQELIAAITVESSARELETMEPASPEATTPASPQIRASQSDLSEG
jgi:serine/threonine protein kinase